MLIRIGSAAGATVYEHTLEQGQRLRLGLGKPLWIRLGAPWNLDATIGRHSLTSSLPNATGDVIVTKSGLHSAP